MAIDIKFDLTNNPEPPTIVLATRNGKKLGQLDVNIESVDLSDNLTEACEFTFTLNKYVDGKLTNLWDKVVDFKLVYCKEWDKWFEITVELDEATETVKTVFCTQLGQAELSQIMLYNIEINTEDDIARDDYKISILYDENDPKASILNRILDDKAPHYRIAYVDETLKRIQRSFSFDDTSICDALDEVEEEVGCLVIYNSNSDKGEMPNRTISVYDLQQNCNDCGYRGEFTDKCPKCGSTDIKYGYGEDTTIFVTADELGSQGIQLITDTDSVKNCFKLEGGDDLMTATIRNCNPNGSDYIWYFSDAVKEDMSEELVKKIEDYDKLYKKYYDSYISNLDENLVFSTCLNCGYKGDFFDKCSDCESEQIKVGYKGLVRKYEPYYNTKSVCLNSNCKHEGVFESQCPECGSENILTGKSLQTISTPITGYSALMNAYYNTIDLAWYLKSGLMPNVAMSKTNAVDEAKSLVDYFADSEHSVAVNVDNIASVSLPTANSAVLSMAKIIVKSTYKVEVNTSTLSDNKVWEGNFIITNYSDDEDTAVSDTISVIINNDTEAFIKQKIDKALNKENTDDYSISGLFKKEIKLDENGEHIVDENGNCKCEFCAELKKYALNPLKSFYDACDACLNILIDQGAGDKDKTPDLYKDLYNPYYNKSSAIAEEIKIRENEIAVIEGVYDETDEKNRVLITEGLQANIEKCKSEIQNALNFESYIGKDLWLEFCSYRREDKYSNDNYISDGLNNAELFKKANEFIEVAENEIFKSAELQHSISATLNNFLAIPKFKSLVKHFKTGNWIRVQIDDKIYKLRLLKYDISYGDLKNIPVEFSDVTKIKNGVTDVKAIIEQASSMASSYDSVQRQAQKGNVARSTIDQWIVDGLNSADVQITSNDSEEILLTKNGLLARSYDDITGTYSPEQFKLTHNIMAYTDDNWKTVSAALGKHNYQYYKDGNLVDAEGYGLSAKFAQAAYIIGSQFIGGEIISSNYEPKAEGTYINLLNGEFDFAGGKIVYDIDDDDPKKSTLTLKGVTIQWDGEDGVNAPEVKIENITDLGDEIDKINTMNDALSPTTINGKSVISPLIVGGYLNIKNDTDKTGVIIDPNKLVNDDYVFRVYNKDGTAIGLDVDGNAEFSGTINGSHFVGGDLLIGDSTKVGDYAEIDNSGKLTCTNVDIRGGVLKIGSEYDENGNPIAHTWISEDGVLTTYDANIQGTLRSPTIIGGTIEGGSLLIGNKDDGYAAWISDEDGIFHAYGAVIEGDSHFTGAITATSLTLSSDMRIGNDENGYHTWIGTDGILNAWGAKITGEIHASVGGTIAGWNVTKDGISKNTTLINSNDANTYASLVIPGAESPVRFSANSNFKVLDDGSLYASAVKLGDGDIGQDASIFINTTDMTGVGGFFEGASTTTDDGTTTRADDAINNWRITVGSNFGVTSTGGLYCSDIRADGGLIGGWLLDSTGFKLPNSAVSLTNHGLDLGGIRFETEATGWDTTWNVLRFADILQIVNNEGDGLFFGEPKGTQTVYRITLSVIERTNNDITIRAQLVDGQIPYKGVRLKLYWGRHSPKGLFFKGSEDSGFVELGFVDTVLYSDFTLKFSDIGTENLHTDYLGFSVVNEETALEVARNNVNTNYHCDTIWDAGEYMGNDDECGGAFALHDSIGTISCSYSIEPSLADKSNTLGTKSMPWYEIYAKKYYGDTLQIQDMSSDIRVKNSISALPSEYEVFFDKMEPTRYKYNEGTSNRYHTGFIAQQLVTALEESGLTTQDFAGVMLDNPGEEDECWYLRRDEFVALNTWQIQKLKARTTELENKVVELEGRISQLENK